MSVQSVVHTYRAFQTLVLMRNVCIAEVIRSKGSCKLS